MSYHYFILIAAILVFTCEQRQEYQAEIAKDSKSDTVQHREPKQEKHFVSFLTVDSIAVFDKSIKDTAIDSIDIREMKFKAKYIGCFKGQIKKSLYSKLKTKSPQRYKQVMAITTAHEIVLTDSSFHFNGVQSVGCNYPESSKVSIHSTLYSLYSNLRLLGRIMIIDSIDGKQNVRR